MGKHNAATVFPFSKELISSREVLGVGEGVLQKGKMQGKLLKC